MNYDMHWTGQLVGAQALYGDPGRKLPLDAGENLTRPAVPYVADHQPRVMIADNDPNTQRMLSNYLGQNNMQVAIASGKQDITRLMATEHFSIIVFDLHLGQEDGLDLLRDLRARSNVPIIAITGAQHDEIDRVVSLELGADDCLTRPFSLRELLARIRVVLRRVGTKAGKDVSKPGSDTTATRLRFGNWTLNRRTFQLADAEGNPIALTKCGYALLLAFLDAPQRPLSREHLLAPIPFS